ncbi:MAG TPA: circadian clock protein KaiC [Nitrospirota bacterium]|nr:circadian clock protein KaiC [Nitrospirota bacterium]
MAIKTKKRGRVAGPLAKCPTGINGLDQITGGGLPQGRPTLLSGAAGCGKTLFAMEFLVEGVRRFNEPGVFVSFEENSEELAKNFSSLGFNIEELSKRRKIALEYIYIERSEIEVTGEYDLEGLFIRLQHIVNSIGAKRIVLDTIEALFSALPNEGILRAEIRRLFRWIKSKGLTAIVTAEKGHGDMTRHGLEEYVSDCAIVLDHNVVDQVATRRMRIVKYRGSSHGTNEYPFLIDETGISVLPITSVTLQHESSTERVSTGIPRLDAMMGGKGFFRGSSVLVSGTAGTGKSSMAAHFADAACIRRERCLYLAFEESENQIIRNMRSIGIDLEPHVKNGLLRFHASRPSMYGLETHLATIHKLIDDFKPRSVIFDPITNLIAVASVTDVKAMMTRLIDYLKLKKITSFYTNLSHQSGLEQTDVGISSLMDTWISLRDIEQTGERNRGLYLLKSRGMAHSNQIREFLITNKGVDLIDVYLGAGAVFTGSARAAQEAHEKAEAVLRREEIQRKKRQLEQKRRVMEAQIAALHSQYESEENELRITLEQLKLKEKVVQEETDTISIRRKADETLKKTAIRKGAASR